jgi:hypothetical protein
MIKRNRPRPNNGGVRQHRPHQNGYSSNPNSKHDDSSEVRLKNRGYYQQMFDKYTTAARESLSLGERIEAEGHYQHAEHYLRQLNDRIKYDNEAQQQQQQRYQAQQAQQQAQLAQQNQQAAKAAQAAQSSDAVEATADNAVNSVAPNGDATPDAPAQEKRPYRKRVLRTPHRRHTPQEGAPAQATAPSDSPAYE